MTLMGQLGGFNRKLQVYSPSCLDQETAKVLGLTQTEIEPESTISVADAPSTRSLISLFDLTVVIETRLFAYHSEG